MAIFGSLASAGVIGCVAMYGELRTLKERDATLIAMQADVKSLHDQILSMDKRRDDGQDKRMDMLDGSIRKFWRYAGAMEMAINKTRARMNPPMDVMDHPDLTN